jgi:hypothetical protein
VALDRSPTAPYDLTALAPATTAIPTAVLDGDTMVAGADVLPSPRRRSPRWALAALALVLLIALGVGLAVGLGSNTPTGSATTVTSTTTHHGGTSAKGSSSTTTLTILAPGPAALATLVRDVVSAESSGALTSATASGITGPANQALTDEAAGDAAAATTDLGLAATATASAGQSGAISGSQQSVLQSDLAALAGALGLSGAATPTTTAPTPASPSHGHGNGNGDGSGTGN